jgi:hypothetical protein
VPSEKCIDDEGCDIVVVPRRDGIDRRYDPELDAHAGVKTFEVEFVVHQVLSNPTLDIGLLHVDVVIDDEGDLRPARTTVAILRGIFSIVRADLPAKRASDAHNRLHNFSEPISGREAFQMSETVTDRWLCIFHLTESYNLPSVGRHRSSSELVH